jgi:hypothetical protein
MTPRTFLSREQGVTRKLATVASTCATTGVLTYVIDKHSAWLQWSVLVHVISGVALSVLLGGYLYLHFRRTLGMRRMGMLLSGLFSSLLALALVATGLSIILQGQREASRWVYTGHVYAAAGAAGVVLLHVLLHLRRPAGRKAGPTDATFASFSPGMAKEALLYTAGGQLFILLVSGVYSLLEPKYSELPSVRNYQYNYGAHRFRPSQTETANNAFVDSRQIANSRRCVACHRDIAEQWFSSAHRQAASDAAYVTNIDLLTAKRGISAARYCEGCHAPVALLSGELSPGGKHGGIAGTPANEEGVTCMACHGIESLVHLKGVASYSWKPREEYLFGQSDNSLLLRVQELLIRVRPQQHRTELGKPLFRDPKYCAACHTQFMDKDFNNWGWVKMQDDYGAWLKSPYSKQHEASFAERTVTRCQDCHMPLVPAPDPSADDDGKVRSHRFLGANTFLPILARDEDHLARTKEFLQSDKMRINIEHPTRKDVLQTPQPLNEHLRNFEEAPYYYYIGETAKLRVAVTNRGVGHDFPGGTLDVNEAWVEIVALDAEGAEVYSSGRIRSDNSVDPSANFYRTLPVDRKGDLVWRHDLFNMIGESFRRTIPAAESDIVEYSFVIPAWAKSPLTVTASLKYRKLNDRYARWALKDKYIQIPAVNLAWTSLDLPLRLRQEVN